MPERMAGQAALIASLGQALAVAFPYPHWLLTKTLPPDLVRALAALPLAMPAAACVGCPRPAAARRHPIMRFETEGFAACRAVAETFRSPATTAMLSKTLGIELSDCRPSLTLAREVDGFRDPPRTRSGEARVTLMIALATGGQRNLGPDIYFGSGEWASQAPWKPGCALAFAPSGRSWHGFEPRMIREMRTSLIVDYAEAYR